MGGMFRRKALMGLLALAGAGALANDADAAGFQLREQSAEGLGNAFAGSAAKAYDPSTIYYNPAGMTRLDGNQTSTSSAYIMPDAKFTGQATKAGFSGTVNGVNQRDAIMDAAIGSVYGMWDARPDLKFGVAVTTPYGLRSSYDEHWVGRYHALETSVTDINVSPSVAYRVNDNLSLGGGIQMAYVHARLTNSINFAGLGAGTSDGKATVEGDDIGVGGDFGVLWEFSPTSRVGVNYRSQIQHTLQGKARFQNVPAAMANNVNFANDSVKADLTTPDNVAFSVYHELTPSWALMSDIQWTRWSSFKELRVRFANGRPDSVVNENWHDTMFYSLGTTYKVDRQSSVHFGAAYDQSAVNDTYRTARIPETARYWLSAGYVYAFDGGQLNLSYAHLIANDTTLNELGTTAAANGNLTGIYQSQIDIVSASYNLTF